MIALVLGGLLAVVGPLAQAAPNPSVSSAPIAEDPKVTQRVKTEFLAWQHGSLDRSAYSPQANEQLNDDAVDVMSDHLKPLGAVRSTVSHYSYKESGSTIYVYSVRCEKGNVRMKLGLDTAGKVSAVSFEPES